MLPFDEVATAIGRLQTQIKTLEAENARLKEAAALFSSLEEEAATRGPLSLDRTSGA